VGNGYLFAVMVWSKECKGLLASINFVCIILQMKKRKTKRYQDMNAAELAEATKEYDQPGTIHGTRPMTPAERAEERKARRRAGRPRIGRGSERINITIERGLLADADAVARRQKIGRSELIARSLQLMLIRKAV